MVASFRPVQQQFEIFAISRLGLCLLCTRELNSLDPPHSTARDLWGARQPISRVDGPIKTLYRSSLLGGREEEDARGRGARGREAGEGRALTHAPTLLGLKRAPLLQLPSVQFGRILRPTCQIRLMPPQTFIWVVWPKVRPC